VHDWSQPREIFTLTGHTDEVTHAIYNPDGSKIVTLSKDSTARIWDAESGAGVSTLIGHSSAVRSAVFHNGGAQIKTFAGDRFIKVWNVKTGKEVSSTPVNLAEEPIISVDFSPDGSLLALGLKGYSEVYNAETGKRLYQLSPFGHPGLRVNTMDISFRPDGNRIVTAAYSHEVAVWDSRTGTRILNLHEHGQGCLSVVYNPDMTLIASGSRDKTVIVWDARLGTIKKKLKIGKEVHTVAFSPDGSTLLVMASATGSNISDASFWDIATYKQVSTISGLTRTSSVSFSPNGSCVVIPSGNTVRIFEATTKRELISKKIEDEKMKDLFDITEYEQERAGQSERLFKLVEVAVKDSNGKNRVQAARTLAQSDTALTNVIPKLIDFLNSEENEIRLNAALVSAEIGVPAIEATTELIDLFQNDEDAIIRAAATFAIGCIGDATKKQFAIREFMVALKDEDLHVRYHAAHALDKIGSVDKEVLSALTETMLTDPSFGIQRQIAFNLGNLGEASLNALPTLIEGTSSEDERHRWWSCYAIWCICSGVGENAKSAIPALKKEMLDISNYRDENGGPPMKYAIHALGEIGPIVIEVDSEVIPILGDIMRNNDEYHNRKAAAIALQKILQIEGEKLRHKVRGYKKKT